MAISSSAPETERWEYPDLEHEIQNLRHFAEPLSAEVVVTPLMPVIDTIMQLPEDLSDVPPEKIDAIEKRVAECKRLIEELSYEYINRIISKPNPSKVFQILNNSNLFERNLRKSIGKKVRLESSDEEVDITPQVAEALTRYRFSIGTPPITPEGIKTIEQVLFGGELPNIYGFRDLIGADRQIFDKFLQAVDRLVTQSTHYTTAKEKAEFEREATEFSGLEGLRAFKKSTISGSPQTAIRLMTEHMLSQHSNGSMPMKVVEEPNKLDDELIEQMKANPEALFVVRVTSVKHSIFTDDKLLSKWEGLIGRLVIVDDSPNARKSGTTLVYSMHPPLNEAIDAFHVKDSGTPANTQMNLRRILEDFQSSDLENLRQGVQGKIEEYESKGTHQLTATAIRKQEWQVTQQRDYLNLKKFLEFLDFIEEIKNADEDSLATKNQELIGQTEENARKYFYKKVKGKNYHCISIPQGGGRRELGLVGKYHTEKVHSHLDDFQPKIEECRAKLMELKSRSGLPIDSMAAVKSQIDRTLRDRRSPEASIRDASGKSGGYGTFVQERLKEQAHNLAEAVEGKLDSARTALDRLTTANPSGQARAKLGEVFARHGRGDLGKMLEGGIARKGGNLLRGVQGMAHRLGSGVLDKVDGLARRVRHGLEDHNYDFAERLLNDIANGSFKPSLALAELGWTFNDVLNEYDFPPENYLKIEVDERGQLNPDSLEEQLRIIDEELMDFPELREIYFSSVVLIINDPHNPTSTVAENTVKLRLLDLASRYGLTVMADEAYHKQVGKPKKDIQGDASLPEFYENNRSRFAKPITIYSTIPTTKWAMGAGRRTGTVFTNDAGFESFVRDNTDSANTMSLYMDNQTYRMGLAVKEVSSRLRPALAIADPEKIIDELLSEDFADLTSDAFIGPLYFALINARNDLDRLKLRTSTPHEYKDVASKYINNLLSDLKNLRLEKQTQRDSVERAKAVARAVTKLEEKYPGLSERCIQPEGPFYMCVKLDEDGSDNASLLPFLQAISRARKIDVVPTAKGYVRFAFGGMVDGTKEGYNLLELAVRVDLDLLLRYWQEFKTKKAEYHEAESFNPEQSALKELFPGGEIEFAQAAKDKEELIQALQSAKNKRRKKVVDDRPEDVDEYIESIEPDSRHHIVTLKRIDCKTMDDFVNSKPFHDLFNHYLLQVRNRIPELQHLSPDHCQARYGALQFAKKCAPGQRRFRDGEKELFAKVATEIAKIWFSDDTIKILADAKATSEDELLGSEEKLSRHIKSFLRVFLTKDQEAQLIKDINKKRRTEEEDTELRFKRSLQIGYSETEGLEGNENLPPFLRALIGKAKFAKTTAPTDPSPDMTTGSVARVAGGDRGIYRRDGDGENAPKPEFFREKLSGFVDKMDPKDYVCKMAQVGGHKVLIVMHRSYSHYLADELRLFPQVDMELHEVDKNVKPDAVSFLGLPSKVMGEDYRLGYYFDQNEDGSMLPISWVDRENITDYMGYLKKPILTVTNELVRQKGMFPIHGSAFTITLKNGLRKTIVMGGDSGTGKSETIIALMEQAMKSEGIADQIENVELLAGDMLSLFEGADGQLYMLGTEQGDFMRTTDISDYWQERYRDIRALGSKTNIDHESNPRITIPGICNPDSFLRPVRVNMFLNINNFQEPPPGKELGEVPSPRNLLMGSYVEGWRGEKGTSGDQPNFFASLSSTKGVDSGEVLRKYAKTLDDLLGWEVLQDANGKAKNALLRFNDVEGGILRAQEMVRDVFVGKILSHKFKGAKEPSNAKITSSRYDALENHFYVTLIDENGQQAETVLDRETIFSKIYNPIASTPCGNPFMHPQDLEKMLDRLAGVMEKAGVITGNLYTQLKVKGMEFEGPAKASHSVIKLITQDPRINERFTKHIRRVNKAIKDKYGIALTEGGQKNLPDEMMALNLLLLERYESDAVRPVDANGQTIDISTPLYHYNPELAAQIEARIKEGKDYEPQLITPDIENTINAVIESKAGQRINLENFNPDLADHANIIAADSRAELIYQIMINFGVVQFGYKDADISKHTPEIMKANKVADAIIKARGWEFEK